MADTARRPSAAAGSPLPLTCVHFKVIATGLGRDPPTIAHGLRIPFGIAGSGSSDRVSRQQATASPIPAQLHSKGFGHVAVAVAVAVSTDTLHLLPPTSGMITFRYFAEGT